MLIESEEVHRQGHARRSNEQVPGTELLFETVLTLSIVVQVSRYLSRELLFYELSEATEILNYVWEM